MLVVNELAKNPKICYADNGFKSIVIVMESFESFIPKDKIENRPEVFSYESFPAIIRLARRFDRLLIPTTPEEANVYEKKYGEPSAAFSQQELESVQSLSALRSLIEERTGVIVRKELEEILNGAVTAQETKPATGEKPFWTGDDAAAILNAVADKRFDKIDDGRDALATTALGLSMVAERARTRNMENALNALPENTLERFGMSSRQREIINLLLDAMTKINTEYMRFQLHIREKDPYDKRPIDALRERKYIAGEFDKIVKKIEEIRGLGAKPIFGTDEKDKAFAGYLLELREAYRAFEEGGTVPLTREEQVRRLEKVQQSFLSMHTIFPEFPLIVFPAFSHYGADEAVDGSRRTWKKFGFDPEIRLYWQTTEGLHKQEAYH